MLGVEVFELPGCSCFWRKQYEGEFEGQMMFYAVLVQADRRCLKHGKPRHVDKPDDPAKM